MKQFLHICGFEKITQIVRDAVNLFRMKEQDSDGFCFKCVK
jgi:hypothetical protein